MQEEEEDDDVTEVEEVRLEAELVLLGAGRPSDLV